MISHYPEEIEITPPGSETTAWDQRRLIGTLGDPEPASTSNNGGREECDQKMGESSCKALEVGSTHSRGNVSVMADHQQVPILEGVDKHTQRSKETAPTPRGGISSITKLERISKYARQNPHDRFTALAHLLNEEFLAHCFRELHRNKAPGMDGISIAEYEENLRGNLKTLVGRLKAKQYRPQPVRRVYIPKGKDARRPLGLPTVEDKIVQMGITKILEAIFEGDFLNVSYGFRPKRGCHDALRAINVAIMAHPVSFVVEADIRGFFDHVNHTWLMECLKQRINDPSLLRLIGRNLRAGVFEEGKLIHTKEGTPQGGVLSPILANIYLHFVLDLWFERVMKKSLRGYAQLIRYADDFVIGCQYRGDAQTVHKELKERLAKFGLTLAEEKTRVIEFGRFAQENARQRGHKAATFDFLGFTHFCTVNRNGKFKIGRKTSRKKFRVKMQAMNQWLKSTRNLLPLPKWWDILQRKLAGHYQYYGISDNYRSIYNFYYRTLRLTYKWWNRRSQRRSGNLKDFQRLLERFPLPKPRIMHNLWNPAWS